MDEWQALRMGAEGGVRKSICILETCATKRERDGATAIHHVKERLGRAKL
jgi:hypothetical protein